VEQAALARCFMTASSKLGVMFVIYGLAPAGPELRLLELARTFPEGPDHIDVHICVVGDDLTLLDEFRKTQAHVVHVPMRRPYAEWRNVRRVLEYIGDNDIRVINSFNLKTLIVCAAAKLRYGSRVRLVHHLISLWDDVGPRQRMALWTMMRCADQVLCNGHAVREGVIGNRRLAAPVSVIPNGVDCDRFRPMPDARAAVRARLGLRDEHFVIGTVGNLRPVKNFPFLLEAMTGLQSLAPHARLLCVGGGPQLEEMKALTASLGLADRVVFTGLARDVRPFMAAMDAFALCSRQEGNPNVILQAMAMALPVVSVKVGEVPALVEPGVTGTLVESGDAGGFLQALSQLAAGPALCRELGEAGRRRVTSLYSSSQMIDRYATLMQHVAA
jgi:glycosyltransferase involved in cell wall biosynthesis